MDVIYQSPVVAVAASTTKSVTKVTSPSGRSNKLLGWKVSSDGLTGVSLRVRLGRITTAGTFTSLTGVKANDDLGATIGTTGGSNASAEPTYSDILDAIYITPNCGGYEKVFTLDSELAIGTADAVAIEVTTGATPTGGVNILAQIIVREG